MSATVTQHKPLRMAGISNAGARPAIFLIALVGAVLRFSNLGERGLWFDEAISVAIARLNWLDTRKVLMNREANMTLYYVLLHYWVKLGISEYFVRSLSALFGAAAVVLIYLLGKRLFGTRAGLAAAALLALNGYHIRYSQEARSYSLVVLLAILSSLLFVEAVERGSRRAWNWYAGISILSAYAHFFGALVIVAQLASLFLAEPREGRAKDVKRSTAWIALGCFPLAWFVVFKDKGQIDWIARPSVRGLYECFFDLAGHGNIVLLAVYAGASLAPIIGAVFVAGRLSRKAAWRLALVISWSLLPIALALAASFRKPIFYSRYLIVSLPALVLLVAVALDWVRPRLAWGLALAVVLGASLSGVRAAYGAGYAPRREYVREETRYILTYSRQGDAALFYHPFGRVAFEYYRDRLSASPNRPQAVYPLRGDGMLVASATASQWKLLAPDSPLMANLAERPRVWFVVTGEPDEKSRWLQKWLGEHFAHVQPHGFGPTRFFLYSK